MEILSQGVNLGKEDTRDLRGGVHPNGRLQGLLTLLWYIKPRHIKEMYWHCCRPNATWSNILSKSVVHLDWLICFDDACQHDDNGIFAQRWKMGMHRQIGCERKSVYIVVGDGIYRKINIEAHKRTTNCWQQQNSPEC